MTLGELNIELLGYLADPDGDYTTPAEATSAFNLGQDILLLNLHPQAVKAMCPKLVGTDTGTTTPTAETFALPTTGFVKAITLQLDGYTARQVNPEDRAAVDGTNTWTAPVASDPAFYIKGSNLHHFAGAAGLASTMTYSLDYIKQATRLASDADNTLFGSQFDEILLNLAAGIRCEKQGATLEGAEQKASTFTQKGMALIEGINKNYG